MKTLRSCILILLCGIIAGYLLLVAVFLVPARSMSGNAAESAAIFAAEGDYPNPLGARNTMLDNYTDALMLGHAAYPGTESPFEKAALSYRLGTGNESTVDDFIQLYASPGGAAQTERIGYARYWHGYLLVLRPLFAILNYPQMRILNLVCQCLLFVLLAALLCRKAPACVLPFLFTALLFVPSAVNRSLQFSSDSYVMMLSLLALLLFQPRLRRANGFVPFFLLVGMLTAYLDLLTFPTVTLTMPLCLAYVLERDSRDTLVKRLRFLLLCCVGWGVGYAGMWAGKWLIVAVFEGRSALSTVWETISFRTGTEVSWGNPSRLATLRTNIVALASNVALSVCLLATTAVYVVGCLRRKVPFGRMLREGIPFVCLCLLPVLWTLVLSNHSQIHRWFTFRNLAPVAFIVLSFLGLLLQRPRAAEESPPDGLL